MEKKQTAVEWLEARAKEREQNNGNKSSYWHLKELFKDFEQAKEMENSQKKEMYVKGLKNYDPTYLNEIYGGNNLEVKMSKPTAVTLLFREFRALSEVTRKAGDEQSANLIDFLCEREDVAKHFEKQQIGDAYRRGFISDDIKLADDYYNETFGGEK